MEKRSEESQPLVLLKRPQNPFRLIELFVKGFCPVIQDSVDVNDHIRSDCEKDKTRDNDNKKLSAPRNPPQRGHHHHKPTIDNDEPFELVELPPSDVIGISKKMWEGLCSNSVLCHPTRACRGFCAHHGIHLGDDVPPEGEECSVGTATTSTIDLSPQASPRSMQRQLSLSDSLGEEEHDEEPLPVAEYKNERSYRGTHILILTIVTVYITLAVLRSIGPVDVNFILESKSSSAPGPPVFSINYR